MKDTKWEFGKALALGAVLMTASAAANAQGASDDWQYGMMIYGWLPSISGDLRFGGDIEVDADRIIDSLNMTFMGSFEARNGDWSAFTDIIYLDLGGDKSKSVSVPDGGSRTLYDADLEMTGWIWTLGGAYTLWREQKSHMDLFAGARLLTLDNELKLTGGGPGHPDRKLSESVELWDGIVGVKGRAALEGRWFLPYYLDVGAGDSDLTWQVAAGVGYSFDWGDVTLEYRDLEYDQDDDKAIQDIGFGGAMLGVAWQF